MLSEKLQSMPNVEESDINVLVSHYFNSGRSVLDTLAPVVKTLLPVRERRPWFNDNLRENKKIKRKLERKWKASRSYSDFKAFQRAKVNFNSLISKTKEMYYTDFILKNKNDQKLLFSMVHKLIDSKKEPEFPASSSTQQLANDFNNYFIEKVQSIRDEFLEDDMSVSTPHDGRAVPPFSKFTVLSPKIMMSFIQKSNSKSCELDPFPTSILKQCLTDDITLCFITTVVNKSLSEGVFPDELKVACVTPILKKQGLEPAFRNFRPISNLSFLSKLIERVAADQLLSYMRQNELCEVYQSAYKENHSTETALLKVQNDILKAMDDKSVSILIMLDLSSAFDTVDFNVLLCRLETNFGVTGLPLSWFKSYLSNRRQYIKISNTSSSPNTLQCGVPQGSVLGPLLFSIYTSPLGKIIMKYGLSYHLYADDTQLYMSFLPTESHKAAFSINKCLDEIKLWMYSNKLKLNESKTDCIVIGNTKQIDKVTCDVLKVGSSDIITSKNIKNLGVYIDRKFDMERQVNSICASGYFYLKQLYHMKKYLDRDSLESVVHAFVSCRLDYCNSLLYGINKSHLDKLQRLQNCAARLVTGTRKYEHITPVLKELHWLPVRFRIQYKILLLCFKCFYGIAPSYLCDLLAPYNPSCYNFRSCSGNLLHVPKSALATGGDRSFSCVCTSSVEPTSRLYQKS